MNVYLLKDIEKVGLAGNIVKVADGFAQNFLIPRKLAVKITEKNSSFYANKVNKIKADKKILNSKVAMLAENIKNLRFTIKEKVHDEGKLYGAVGSDEIVKLLKTRGISINRKQVEFSKSIRSIGEYKVKIRLSSKLRPEFILKVVSE